MADQDAEIRALAEAGRKIEAIRLYRERYGVGLAEAKRIIDVMDAGVSPAPDSPPGFIYSVGSATSEVEGDADIRAMVAAGKALQAIQLYRQRYGVGLAEAKRAVDSFAEGRAPTRSAAPPAIPSEADALALPEAEFIAIVDRLIRGGQKIQAIKLYRARYGYGLKGSKEFIDSWERNGTPPSLPPALAPVIPPDAGRPAANEYGASIDALARREDELRLQPDEVFAATIDAQVNARNKVEAMRLYRLRYQVGLKEAKDGIDAWERGVRVLPTGTAPAPALSPRLAAEERTPARASEESTAEPCEGHIDERNLGQGIDLALQMGRREEAIQLYQERAGVSRREAEATIAARERQLGGAQPAMKSGCFIATAAFGSESAPEVEALRHFRDAVLARSRAGRRLIQGYYHWSPPLAERLACRPRLRAAVRWILRPLAWFCGCGRN